MKIARFIVRSRRLRDGFVVERGEGACLNPFGVAAAPGAETPLPAVYRRWTVQAGWQR